MHRRQFLQSALQTGTAALAWSALPTTGQSAPAAPSVSASSTAPRAARGLDSAAAASRPLPHPKVRDLALGHIRGVNLGGWLVLESWMVPSLYGTTGAQDEFELCTAWGAEAAARLERHRDSFITAEDFRWIRDRGLNAVRLPVGYWALEPEAPFLSCTPHLDFAFAQAQQHGLHLLLDLHGAPGSQNGWDHSGRAGRIGWHREPALLERTLRVLAGLAARYGQHPALLGIQLLNEPHKDIPLAILRSFYMEAYARLRPALRPAAGLFLHDGFRPREWGDFMGAADYTNVLLDTHCYQCFTDEDKARPARAQVQVALERAAQLAAMEKEALPTIVGEWSLGLPRQATRGLSPLETEALQRAYGHAQLLSYESCHGWFFWSYKLERQGPWHFRHCVERGWLPDQFA